MTEFVPMPKELTAEDGFKFALIGAFFERFTVPCPKCYHFDVAQEDCQICFDEGVYPLNVSVSWCTIKAIYAKAVEHSNALVRAGKKHIVVPRGQLFMED